MKMHRVVCYASRVDEVQRIWRVSQCLPRRLWWTLARSSPSRPTRPSVIKHLPVNVNLQSCPDIASCPSSSAQHLAKVCELVDCNTLRATDHRHPPGRVLCSDGPRHARTPPDMHHNYASRALPHGSPPPPSVHDDDASSHPPGSPVGCYGGLWHLVQG